MIKKSVLHEQHVGLFCNLGFLFAQTYGNEL